MRRVIFHIDVNSAFLSWTAVQLLAKGEKDVRLVPSVVSGDPSDRRSIITAASIPAKKLGIKTAQPVNMALRNCPSLVIVNADWQWYKQCSEGFISICRSYSPILEQFSIDECFLDMSLQLGRKDPVEVATKLKDEIHKSLGFTVNVGIGPNKLLAKMASDFEKPDKVHTLWLEEIQTKMWPLPVRDLLWVGRKTAEKLSASGVNTIGDLAHLGMGSLTHLVGKRFAAQLHDSASGIDMSPVETEVPEAKSYSAERTFSHDLVKPKDIDKALFEVTCIVAHRIRKDKFRTSTVSVFVKYKDFTISQKQGGLSQATDITALILKEARVLLAQAWDGVTPIRQVGLGVSKLTHDTAEQMSIFEDPQMEFYKQWDKDYDKKKSAGKDMRTEAYRKAKKTPEFSYPDAESALLAAKKAVKSENGRSLKRNNTEDGLPCFDVISDDKIIERHRCSPHL